MRKGACMYESEWSQQFSSCIVNNSYIWSKCQGQKYYMIPKKKKKSSNLYTQISRPSPFFHTPRSQKWIGDVYSNIQLVSRICHQSRESAISLKNLPLVSRIYHQSQESAISLTNLPLVSRIYHQSQESTISPKNLPLVPRICHQSQESAISLKNLPLVSRIYHQSQESAISLTNLPLVSRIYHQSQESTISPKNPIIHVTSLVWKNASNFFVWNTQFFVSVNSGNNLWKLKHRTHCLSFILLGVWRMKQKRPPIGFFSGLVR